jgi:hypothetical protein
MKAVDHQAQRRDDKVATHYVDGLHRLVLVVAVDEEPVIHDVYDVEVVLELHHLALYRLEAALQGVLPEVVQQPVVSEQLYLILARVEVAAERQVLQPSAVVGMLVAYVHGVDVPVRQAALLKGEPYVTASVEQQLILTVIQ